MKGVIFHIPLDTATSPTNGEAICGRWWSVHPEKGVAFYARLTGYYASEEPAPQCNPDEAVARHIVERIAPDHEVRHIPVVFMGHAAREMRRLKKEAWANG